jgi:hypothetical protein
MPALATKLMALVAGLAVIAAAAPADAAKRKHAKHKKVVAEQSSNASTRHRGTDIFPAGPLYYNGGDYLGDDPDPNIRFQIWRDLGAHFGSPD